MVYIYIYRDDTGVVKHGNVVEYESVICLSSPVTGCPCPSWIYCKQFGASGQEDVVENIHNATKAILV